jgi:glutamine amidotransferase
MIAIIDYGAGNLRSIARAIEAAGESTIVTSDPEQIYAADGVIFPGVGAAGHAMRKLAEAGMIAPINEVVERGTPFLGVCLGMQLLFDQQEENNTRGLGLLRGRVRSIHNAEKVPHMGWSQSVIRKPLPGLEPGTARYFYFVHSYVVQPDDPDDIAAVTAYGETFPSIVAHDNIWGTQFHPEKSGEHGLELVKSWVDSVRTAREAKAGAR